VDVQPEPSWTAEHLQYYQADVAAEGSPAGIIACAIDHFGQLDFLINNAGMVGGSDVENMADDVWDRILDVNLKAVFKLSRAAIPHLKNSSRGRIVNIGSIMSRLAGPGMGAYTTSKHAVAGLTKTLALRAWGFWHHRQLYFTGRHRQPVLRGPPLQQTHPSPNSGPRNLQLADSDNRKILPTRSISCLLQRQPLLRPMA
jgi:hypothetical protein